MNGDARQGKAPKVEQLVLFEQKKRGGKRRGAGRPPKAARAGNGTSDGRFMMRGIPSTSCCGR